jgi:hypothetical protein
MKTVCVLYVSHVRSGDVENIGQYGSFTEASQMIAGRVETLVDAKCLVIDRNCTTDNALTKIKDEKYIVKNMQFKTDIYAVIKKKGIVYNSYATELVYSIGILEVVIQNEIPVPPPPPPSTPEPKKHVIIKPPKQNLLSDSYVNELKLAVSTFQNKKILGFQNKKIKIPSSVNLDDIIKKYK